MANFDPQKFNKQIAKLSPEKRRFLAQRLEEEGVSFPIGEYIYPVSRDKDLPLSFAQQRLWFLDQYEPDLTAYNITNAFRIEGPLDVDALKKSFAEIIRRHEPLRTTFESKNGQPRQIVASKPDFSLHRIELHQLPADKREAEVRRIAEQDVQQAFDLTKRVLRASLIKLDYEDHILLISTHHIATDGWSQEIFYRELGVLYKAISMGNPSPLPDLSIQYADFAFWQREWLQGKVLDAQQDYWVKQLENAPVLELPSDHPRPPMQTFEGAMHRFQLSSPVTEKLKELSQRENATMFMALLAAFNVLLMRYSGQEDMVVGTPIANRNREEIEGIIGFFTNTLVIRSDLSREISFNELLSRVRETSLDAYTHQDLPFEKLVLEINPDRDLSRNPIFQVLFAWQNAPKYAFELPGLTIYPVEIDTVTTHFDLSLDIREQNGELLGQFTYNINLFDESRIVRMGEHFQTLISGIIEHSDMPISRLPMLANKEMDLILKTWNSTQTPYSSDLLVHELFETQAKRTPDNIAVFFEEHELTYAELNSRANQLAHSLRILGVRPEVLVGIYLERSIEMIIGILGILKAGGAYVPIDPAYPKQRVAYIIEDTQAAVLLTQQRLIKSLHIKGTHVVCLDTDWDVIAQKNRENLSNQIIPENLAYVIYTSGSTGRPKGVMIQHKSLSNLVQSTIDEYGLTYRDRILQFASISFDTSVVQIFPGLVKGATLVLRTDTMLDTVSGFLQKCRDWELTVIGLPTSYWHELSSNIAPDPSSFPPSLRLVAFGGEEANWEYLIAWQKLINQQIKLINAYGPTEATVDATHWICKPDHEGHSVPIGKPIANTQTYILDSNLQLVPIGIPGELCISGTALARGYFNLPGPTAEKFLPNPFDQEGGTRLYRTGDLARDLPDGTTEYLGRMDDQVKIRGYRIELGEIEVVLSQHQEVRDVVVVAREDIPGDLRLMAYVIPNRGSNPSTPELRDYLKEKLPDYMLPSEYVLLEDFPLTPNDKIDRRALPVPDWSRSDLKNVFEPPRTTIEKLLLSIWEEVLGIKQIDIHDNFFDLGGHSMLAVRLLSRIDKECGYSLSLITLFQAPTINSLAKYIEEREHGIPSGGKSLVLIQPEGPKPPVFCLPGMLGNVFTDLGDLARFLGEEQPFYGLQDGLHNPTEIRSMAASYVDEIKHVQPEGPYYLVGICSGAVVAYEMAQQLKKHGQKVAFLGMIEPTPPERPGLIKYFDFTAMTIRRIVQRLGKHTQRVAQLDMDQRANYYRLRWKVLANSFALNRYIPQNYSGKINLFLTEDSMMVLNNSQLSWMKFAAEGSQVHSFPGTHDTITGADDTTIETHHMRALAQQIGACISQQPNER